MTVIFGLVLLVVTLGAFVALVQRAFELTQIGGIFRGLMRRAGAVIDDVHPLAPATPATRSGDRLRPRRRRSSCTRGRPPSSRRSIARRCCGSPRETGGFVEVLPMVGQYVAPGTPVLRVHGGRSAPPATARGGSSCWRASARSTRTRRSRCGCWSTSRSARCRPRSTIRRPPSRRSTGSRGCSSSCIAAPRARRSCSTATASPGGRVPAPTWTDYLELAVTEIRHYGAGSVAGRPAPARALRPPARGGRRGRPAARRARAAAARRGAARGASPTRRGPSWPRPDRLGLGAGG